MTLSIIPYLSNGICIPIRITHRARPTPLIVALRRRRRIGGSRRPGPGRRSEMGGDNEVDVILRVARVGPPPRRRAALFRTHRRSRPRPRYKKNSEVAVRSESFRVPGAVKPPASAPRGPRPTPPFAGRRLAARRLPPDHGRGPPEPRRGPPGPHRGRDAVRERGVDESRRFPLGTAPSS